MWVFDATPLIYLAKVERLGLIEHIDEPCVIPNRVYIEVVETGIEQGYPDARRVERRVESGTLDVRAVDSSEFAERLRGNDNLSDADVSVLACANAHDATAVMDETYGRNVAAAEGVRTRGTAYLVLSAVSKGWISSTEGRDAIGAMLDAGWYCAPDTYSKIVRELDTL